MKKRPTTRVREKFDHELAITNDILALAQRLAYQHGGWRVALRALYYVVMRINSERGRKQYGEFLTTEPQ